MKKQQPYLLFAFVLATLASCQQNNTTQSSNTLSIGTLQMQAANDPAWQFENLQLYPVLNTNPGDGALSGLKLLSEAMQIPGFRILEHKQFGRTSEGMVNSLTVVNKSQDTVLLLSGDVVTGGNQDRVIAQNEIVMPGTIRNIPVFCVEQHRWQYYDSTATDPERQVAAFRGYYNMASPTVRNAVYAGNQHGVWSAVGKITSASKTETPTATYAALEQEGEVKKRRDAYLQFFENKSEAYPRMSGVVAVCNGKVIGVDIFSSPDIFHRQFKSLLHGYAADASTTAGSENADPKDAADAFRQVANRARSNQESDENIGKFNWNGKWVHLYWK